MLKTLSNQFSALALIGIWMLTVIVGLPSAAQASKAPQSVVFDPAGTAISVVATYETTPATQKEVLTSAVKSSKSLYKKAPGFSGFSVLKSEDGERVITLTQWQDRASYEAAIATPTAETEKSKKSAKFDETDAVTPTETTVFEIDKTQAPEGMLVAIRGQDSLVQFSELTAKSPDDQAKVIAAAEKMLPAMATLYPAPRSALLLKGVDSAQVALLANWGYLDEFQDVSKVPTLEPVSDDVATLIETDQRLYDVVKVIAPKPPKAEKSDD